MGTVVSIDVRSPLGAAGLDAAIGAAVRLLHRVDEDFSTFRPTSWTSRLRRGEIELEDCPDHVREVYRVAAECRDQTGGWFDPAWRGDGTLDPTGLVKGWAADAASAVLTAAGAPSHCVSAAGDVRVRGTSGWAPGRPWRIGIADPFDRARLVAVVEGTELAVATSGIAERGAHVVDPRSGAPATGLASVTLVGADATFADAFATAALAAGPDAPTLLSHLGREGWEWLTVDTTGRLAHSAGFPGQVTTTAAGPVAATAPRPVVGAGIPSPVVGAGTARPAEGGTAPRPAAGRPAGG
ncbi:FAD:protein FMN transferase [Frankia sp. Mgl5]|uniref:FAD:protein FMN transferase n=1 Tax=Frankia sp. Mgl5 TaxID=2933793 RepID=UPI00200CCFDD|nr:FAD:protein FMN transferase [Frankia sp. Mgl5]MCK9926657.1 FAD:protein FMN transferase [Frankia sp. Mgl5]